MNIRYLALGQRPEWFLAVSPQGRAPAFSLDGVTSLFDVRAATALVEETAGVDSRAETAVFRAKQRDFIARVGDLLDAMRGMFLSKQEEALAASERAVFGILSELELRHEVLDVDRLNGPARALAPAFCLMAPFESLLADAQWGNAPMLRSAGLRLLEMDVVQSSKCPDYEAEFERFFAVTGGGYGGLRG